MCKENSDGDLHSSACFTVDLTQQRHCVETLSIPKVLEFEILFILQDSLILNHNIGPGISDRVFANQCLAGDPWHESPHSCD